jgi:preprotein translocase subunit SecD
MKIEEIIGEWRLILLVFLIVMSFFWIKPFSDTSGVVVDLASSPASQSLTTGDVITSMNGITINNLQDYYSALDSISPGDVVRVTYKVETFPYLYSDGTAYPFVADSDENNDTDLGLAVSNVPSSNIEMGLEIQGGTKVLLQPERSLNNAEIENILAIFDQRLNVYGLKEIPITYQQDLASNQYFRLEFAGATKEEVTSLLEREGKFEAKILNETVISGSDIIDVCIVGGTQCVARVDPMQASDGMIGWTFAFQIDLSQEAAQKFADATANLTTGECDATGCYLNETIDFYLDDEPIEGSQLRISEDLRGEAVTSPTISGYANSKSEAENEMKSMQATLQSGELPVSMEVVRIESISPKFGSEFVQNVFLVFIIAIISVDLLVGLRYKNIKIAIPIIIISLAEIFITLGVAAAINWTLDLASIAGLIAAVGTGVDDQIVITDEILRGNKEERTRSIKRRISNAFFIIIAAFACTVATMIPLLFAGAGLLRGFAITTIIAVSVGIFITRPAFARILEHLLGKN